MKNTLQKQLITDIQFVTLYHSSMKNVICGDKERGDQPRLKIKLRDKHIQLFFTSIINERPEKKKSSRLDIHFIMKETKIVKDYLIRVKLNLEKSSKNILFDDTSRTKPDPSSLDPAKPLPKMEPLEKILLKKLIINSTSYNNKFQVVPSGNNSPYLYVDWEKYEYMDRDYRIHFGLPYIGVQEDQISKPSNKKLNYICLYIDYSELGHLIRGLNYGLKLYAKLNATAS